MGRILIATAAQVHTLTAKSEKPREIDCWLQGAKAPSIEARSLFRLVGKNGDTIEKIRSLIAVPPEIQAVLRAYAARYPEDASVERALEFRCRVGEEFERLACRTPMQTHPQ